MLLWVRIKPNYLNDALCSKFVCTCVAVRVVFFLVFVSECVLDNRAIAEPLTVWPFCWIEFLCGKREPVCVRDKGLLAETQRLYFSKTFWKTFRGAEREYKKEQTWVFFFLIHTITLPSPETTYIMFFPFIHFLLTENVSHEMLLNRLFLTGSFTNTKCSFKN